jgi:CIC family chloride channel protein
VTVMLLKRSILTEKIARRGLHLTREYSVDLFRIMRVREVMAAPVDTLPAAMTVDEAVGFFTGEARRHKSYPVVDEAGRVVGMAARAEILRWMMDEGETRMLGETVQDGDMLSAQPDELVGELVERMVERDIGRVPVLDEAGRAVGLVARKDLLRVHARQRALEADREAAPFFGPRAKAET